MFNNKSITRNSNIFALIVGFTSGCIFCLCFLNFFINHIEFMKFSLIQIIQLVSNIFIAIFVMYFIRNTINISKEKREFWSKSTYELKSIVSIINDIQHKYIETNGDNNLAIQIIHEFDNAWNLLSFIIDSSSHANDQDLTKGIINSFFEYKKNVTSEPFQSSKIDYSSDKIATIQISYRRLLRSIRVMHLNSMK